MQLNRCIKRARYSQLFTRQTNGDSDLIQW